jgi:hypothetical protein
MSERAPQKEPNGAPETQDGTLAELVLLAEEYNRDKKVLRVAAAIAVAFHVFLFMVHFPEMAAGDREQKERERKIFVVQQPMFKPPEVKQQEDIIKPKTIRVPIPDPTPDEPEPIRELQPQEVVHDFVPDDAIFDLPGAPPAPPTRARSASGVRSRSRRRSAR